MDSPGLPFRSKVDLPEFTEQKRNPSLKEGTSAEKLLSQTASSLEKSIERERKNREKDYKKKV